MTTSDYATYIASIWPRRLHQIAGGNAGSDLERWRIVGRDAVVFPELVAVADALLDPAMLDGRCHPRPPRRRRTTRIRQRPRTASRVARFGDVARTLGEQVLGRDPTGPLGRTTDLPKANLMT
ncbi:hypothetical protein HRW07_13250 [Streptomyces lunaelactis]|uniref:hypothetical protein n=1 Tax=Streptomyces lunaelactis TaxID=1535768 RepID=UPI0015846DAF|nr:hypothetical protein [Streptomyces lunaelactis]NUL04180.1 hypothetical protein [Streptomyces lunaelactis]